MEDKRDGKITQTEAARMIGVAKQTLSNWAKHGKGPAYFQAAPHCQCLYNPADVEQWIRDNTKNPECEKDDKTV